MSRKGLALCAFTLAGKWKRGKSLKGPEKFPAKAKGSDVLLALRTFCFYVFTGERCWASGHRGHDPLWRVAPGDLVRLGIVSPDNTESACTRSLVKASTCLESSHPGLRVQWPNAQWAPWAPSRIHS